MNTDVSVRRSEKSRERRKTAQGCCAMWHGSSTMARCDRAMWHGCATCILLGANWWWL